MKCRKCGEKAVFHMPHHRLALCQPHYLDWFVQQTGHAIRKYQMTYPGERVLVAVSGGKDSLSLWDVLWRLGLPTEGLYIHLGIPTYSDQSQACTEAFAAQRGLSLHTFNVARVYGETIPEIAARAHRGQGRPCSVCGLVKRHTFNQVAARCNCQVLATGHNLDDEAAVLLTNTLSWNQDRSSRSRSYPTGW